MEDEPSVARMTIPKNKMPEKNTICLTLSADSVTSPTAQLAIGRAAQVLRSGGTVAFPTETVYGLGADALNLAAVEGIFLAKQRPAWDPVIVHVADRDMLDRIALRVSAATERRVDRLIDKFWPGPLTLLLPKQAVVPSAVTSGRPLVGVRMPAHPVALALIAAAGVPIAAPSANRFGHTSPTTAQHVLDDLEGRIDLLLDAGPAWCGVESTVIEVGEQATILYRPGAVAAEEIEAIAGPVILYQPPPAQPASVAQPSSLPSPGVGIRHYAPRARLIPVEIEADEEAGGQTRWLRAVMEESRNAAKVGVMLPTDWPVPAGFCGVRYGWGSWQNDRELARGLFAGLRALDATGAEIILCPLPAPFGLGSAIRDRLLKAARSQ